MQAGGYTCSICLYLIEVTPQKATLNSMRILSWCVTYRSLSPQLKFSLSAVTLVIYLGGRDSPLLSRGRTRTLAPLGGGTLRHRRPPRPGWGLSSSGCTAADVYLQRELLGRIRIILINLTHETLAIAKRGNVENTKYFVQYFRHKNSSIPTSVW